MQNASHLLQKWSSAFKISQTHLKRNHLSYVANSFAIILYFWIYHIHTVIQNLKLFFHEILCTFLRCWKIHCKHDSKIETKLVFFLYFFLYCKHLWLWIKYYTVRKKINTSTMCRCVFIGLFKSHDWLVLKEHSTFFGNRLILQLP